MQDRYVDGGVSDDACSLPDLISNGECVSYNPLILQRMKKDRME